MRVFFIMPDGTELTAGPPAGITLRRDADTPADSLKLSFAFDFPAELEPCAARLEYNGETVFDGIVDEQAVHFEKGEKSTSFSLRSRTALLLDNEAEPGTIRMPSLRLMEQRVAIYAPLLGRQPSKVMVREQKSRWGSCISKGELRFKWKLIMAPPSVVDYVAVHELCHLKEMNHSAAFWKLVETLCPEHKACRQWLKDYGALLAFDVIREDNQERSMNNGAV